MSRRQQARAAVPSRSPLWQFLLMSVGIAIVVASALGLIGFTWIRLRHRVEPASEARLAACLSDNMIPDLSVTGEALIERACEEKAKDPASLVAHCILSRSADFATDEGARAVASRCGVQLSLQ